MRIMRFLASTITFAILVMFFMAYSNNTGFHGGVFKLETYWDSFLATFGGLSSFLAVLGFLGLMALTYFALRFIGDINRDLSYVVAVILIAIAAFIGATWIHIDLAFFGGLWPFIGFLVACAVSTALILAVYGAGATRRRTTATSTTTTTP